MNFLVNEYQKQITSGLTPTQVKFSTSLPVLRDATVAGIVDVYDFMNTFTGRELVKRVQDISCVVFYFCSDTILAGLGTLHSKRMEFFG
jgi:hypothetical protein